ncbi:GAF domain-containing protein [Gloeocapsopsis crepidinum LEGE 06123]|uniref:GAF domain-containing protein n=1 Tax=Gloeocapsopsis crepidinum LEGE 06123 TaxID=588587 RepID=A0ABR9UV97_9CHRO|nr:GAF domain-containing protein [Gloeocapsopsis crepidinum]MBE9192222.1 GAF domain-containing protein [Gloeocapsopsis crepidinum LEGE 06123]
MNAVKFPFISQHFRWKEAVVTTLLGWVPLSVGRALRRRTYSSIFAQFGNSVQIKTGVELIHTSRIEIGNGVRIDRGVCLRNTGQNSRIRLRDFVKIDLGVIIKTHKSGDIEIGNNTYVGPYTCLSGNYIKIGRDCRIASHLGIYANNHNFGDPNRTIRGQGSSYKGIVIEDNCWLGSGVKVLDGVTVGQGSVIGAGAVVTKNIPPYSVAVGVPARVIKNRRTQEQTTTSQVSKENTDNDDNLTVCSDTNMVETENTHHKAQQLVQKDTDLRNSMLETPLYQLLNGMRQIVNMDTATVLLQTQDKEQLAVHTSIGLEDEITAGIRIPLRQGFAGRIAAECQLMIVEDLSTIEVVSPILRNKGLHSMLGIPLQAEGEVLGVFHVGSYVSRKFTRDEVKLLEYFANCLGFAIAHAEGLIIPLWKHQVVPQT